MGSFFICKYCHNNAYSIQQKYEFQFPQSIPCNICGKINICTEYEVQQERYDLSCPICDGRFFIRKMPPISVKCPHSYSSLHISSDGSISVIEAGSRPTTTRGGSIAGAI